MEEPVKVRKRLILQAIILSSVALISGLMILVFAIANLKQTLEGTAANDPAFFIDRFPVSWNLVLVTVCGAVSLTGTAASSHIVMQIIASFKNEKPANPD